MKIKHKRMLRGYNMRRVFTYLIALPISLTMLWYAIFYAIWYISTLF